MRTRAGILSVAAGLGIVALAFVARPPQAELPVAAGEMAQAASNFLASLTPDQQRRVTYLFKDEERRNFHFFPIPRRGVPLKELNDAQRHLAYALLATGLGPKGYSKALTVMSLGQVLRDLEPQSPNPFRDSDQYYVTIFGKPDPKGTWGWRVEGFHLSVNYTVVDGRLIAPSPSFMGAHPALVKEGPRKGLRALAPEEDLARALYASLDAEQRKQATGVLPKFEDTVGGFVTGNARKLERGTPEGIPMSRLTPEQGARLMELVREFAHRHRRELAEQDLAKVEAAGKEKIHFRWDGSSVPFEPHHYLIQGPTFLVEYDNTQDGANHVHCIWRDFDGDFGDDLLREHYRRQHGR